MADNPVTAPSDIAAPTTAGVRLGPALFLVSVLGLFLELVLIRWIGTEVRIFAYLQNTILVVCFLGLGLGCLSCRQPVAWRDVLLPLNILLLLLAIPITREVLASLSELLSGFGGLVIWYDERTIKPEHAAMFGLAGLVGTFVLMMLIWDIFLPLGRLLGRLLDDHPRTIQAYSINVAGSLLGIWLFVLLSALYQPPWTWMLVTAVLLGVLALQIQPFTRLEWVLLAALVPLGWLANVPPASVREVIWSPYQKLALVPGFPDQPDRGNFIIFVNNVGYQAMLDVSPARVLANPKDFPPELRGISQYELPTALHPKAQRVLIVGAGAGNDAAGAVRAGAAEVVAVEIDPAIIELGRRHHPEDPYRDGSRVQVVNDDARSYFAVAPEKSFDVVTFGLLDSHTTTAMTNARLDHYVYTKESLQRARGLLRDGGILVLSFQDDKPFLADRLSNTIHEVFDGQAPMVFRVPSTFYGWGGLMFVAGDLDAVRKRIAAEPRLATALETWSKDHPPTLPGTTPVTTDDWPYLYLDQPHIPFLYYCLGGLLALLLLRSLYRLGSLAVIRSWERGHWHFFFLGAAFLLLEVQNISKAAVVLGNTWLINAIIISAILVLILLANLLVAWQPAMPLGPVYALLIGSCLGLYFVDLSRFAFLPYVSKAAVVGLLTSLPMLFSGIIFMRSFAAVKRKDAALGANLIGALVGGLLQSVTFVTGIKALLLIVAALYAAALLTRTEDATTVKEPATLDPVAVP